MINEPNLQPKIQHFFELSIPEELIWKHYGEGVLLNLFVKLCWDFLLRFFLRFFWDSFWDFFFNFNFFELFIPEEVIWKHYGRGVLLNNSLANWRRPCFFPHHISPRIQHLIIRGAYILNLAWIRMKAKNCVNRNNKMSLILGLAYFHTIFHQEFNNLVLGGHTS